MQYYVDADKEDEKPITFKIKKVKKKKHFVVKNSLIL